MFYIYTWMSYLCHNHACTMNDIIFEQVIIEIIGQWNSIMSHWHLLAQLLPCIKCRIVTHVQIILYLLCVYTCTSITWPLQIGWLWHWHTVLFNRIFEIWVNGKTWRVLKSWYEGAVGQMTGQGPSMEIWDQERCEAGFCSFSYSFPPDHEHLVTTAWSFRDRPYYQ